MGALIIVAVVLIVAFLIQVLILRWIFRVDEIALYLRQIRDKLYQG